MTGQKRNHRCTYSEGVSHDGYGIALCPVCLLAYLYATALHTALFGNCTEYGLRILLCILRTHRILTYSYSTIDDKSAIPNTETDTMVGSYSCMYSCMYSVLCTVFYLSKLSVIIVCRAAGQRAAAGQRPQGCGKLCPCASVVYQSANGPYCNIHTPERR